MRCVVQPESIDSGAFIMEPHVSNSVLGFIISVSSNITKSDRNITAALKQLLPHEAKAQYDLILPFNGCYKRKCSR